jgi:hypothetical protein
MRHASCGPAPISGGMPLEAISPTRRGVAGRQPTSHRIIGAQSGCRPGSKPDSGCRRQWGIGMRRWGLIIVTAVGVLIDENSARAELDIEKVNVLARSCIADHLSVCQQYITKSINDFEDRRKSRGEPTCFVGHSSDDQIIRLFVRAILTKYAYADMPSSDAIENIYKDNCPHQN